jgi:hypothetical protein
MRSAWLLVGGVAALLVAGGCGRPDEDPSSGVGGADAAGGTTGGSGGSGGSGGDAGAGGSMGGTTGTGGSAGASGSAGEGGSAGAAAGSGGGTGGVGGVGGSPGGTGGAGGTGGGTSGCSSNGECAASEFCAKSSCLAVTGTCEPRPTTCTATESPVCGCDGISYWNDCLRQQYGIASSTLFTCSSTDPNTQSCGGFANLQCPNPNAVCAYMFPGKLTCQISDPLGKCWVMPAQCPSIVVGASWRDCNGSNTCVSVCNAILSEQPYYHDNTCP